MDKKERALQERLEEYRRLRASERQEGVRPEAPALAYAQQGLEQLEAETGASGLRVSATRPIELTLRNAAPSVPVVVYRDTDGHQYVVPLDPRERVTDPEWQAKQDQWADAVRALPLVMTNVEHAGIGAGGGDEDGHIDPELARECLPEDQWPSDLRTDGPSDPPADVPSCHRAGVPSCRRDGVASSPPTDPTSDRWNGVASGQRGALGLCEDGKHSFSWREGLEDCRYCGEPKRVPT